MKDYNSMDLKQRINTLPIDIFEKEKSVFEMKERVEELSLKMKLIKQNVLDEVTSETVDGKDVFSSDVKRKAETDRRMGTNTTYCETIKEREKVKRDSIFGELEYGFLKRLFRSAECLLKNG